MLALLPWTKWRCLTSKFVCCVGGPPSVPRALAAQICVDADVWHVTRMQETTTHLSALSSQPATTATTHGAPAQRRYALSS